MVLINISLFFVVTGIGYSASGNIQNVNPRDGKSDISLLIV